MSGQVIRTEKHVTIVEAHPYHRYVSDDRPGGHAIVERAYDPRCPRCREGERAVARGSGAGEWRAPPPQRLLRVPRLASARATTFLGSGSGSRDVKIRPRKVSTKCLGGLPSRRVAEMDHLAEFGLLRRLLLLTSPIEGVQITLEGPAIRVGSPLVTAACLPGPDVSLRELVALGAPHREPCTRRNLPDILLHDARDSAGERRGPISSGSSVARAPSQPKRIPSTSVTMSSQSSSKIAPGSSARANEGATCPAFRLARAPTGVYTLRSTC
jgi:hypothetical protein